ncbi:MAG TPA: peptide-methionine (R)-S-oxide reductase MsrB [Gammaproteobacteria bacterium]|nr:peptide-methionine (R)-S-oxide reductase MsrB [Gammaproteobacteria bacterium]
MSEERISRSDREWRERLSPDAYAATRRGATERPFSGRYVHPDFDGVFRCVGCGAPLFASADQFDSGSGWPSFQHAIDAGSVVERVDRSHGMERTEVRCSRCDAHLGHVFPDGPGPGGLRYCVNSVALELDENAAVSTPGKS